MVRKNCDSAPVRKFGPEMPLVFFHLLQPNSEADPPTVRHRFGFGYNATWLQKNSLPFFRLMSKFTTVPAPHNRVLSDIR